MPNKASTFWPDGVNPSIGDLVSGTRLGKVDRATFRWTPCPQCGYTRWVKLAQVTQHGIGGQKQLVQHSLRGVVSALQSRVVLLEAELTRLQSLLDGSRDSFTSTRHPNLRSYNTLGVREDEGIVQSLSNEDREQNRCSRVCRKQLLRPSSEMTLKNPAKSVKPKSSGYGNAELADSLPNRASVETLHGTPLGVKTKSDSHRKVSKNG